MQLRELSEHSYVEGVSVYLLRGLWGCSRVLIEKYRLWIMYNIVGN